MFYSDMRKLKYSSPVVVKIALDPDQAVLATCVVGGVFFTRTPATGRNACTRSGGARAWSCPRQVRGAGGGLGTFVLGTDAMPS